MTEADLRTLLNALDACRASLHGWLQFWTWLVVAGVALEFVSLLKEYRNELHDFRRGILHPPDKPSLSFFLFGFFGIALVVAGVSGELVIEAKLGTLETKIQKADNELYSLLSKEAGDAKKSAEGAQLALSSVQKQADVITERLNTASQLLDMLGPRWRLLEDNKAAFIKALRPFAGQRITVVSCGLSGPEAIEPGRLGQDLIEFLGDKHHGAGWVVESRDTTWGECILGTEAIGTEDLTPGVGGNVIAFSPVANGVVKGSATELAIILNKLNITTRIVLDARVDTAATVSEPGSPWKLAHEDPTTIVLFVGTNPLFRLTNIDNRPK